MSEIPLYLPQQRALFYKRCTPVVIRVWMMRQVTLDQDSDSEAGPYTSDLDCTGDV